MTGRPSLWWVPVQVFMWVPATVYLVIGKLMTPIMVPIGIYTKWRTPLTWPWDAFINEATGAYYDAWYPDMDNKRHNFISKWAWNKGGFWREFYWRVRNGFSNGMRYTWPQTQDTYTYQGRWVFYQVSIQHPWMCRWKFSQPLIGQWQFELYIGFKVNRAEGSGFTNRLPAFIRRID